MSEGSAGEAEAVFKEAFDLPRDERAPFVAARCRDRPALLGEVRSLLDAMEDAASFMEIPIAAAWLSAHGHAESSRRIGSQIGSAEIVSVVATGGMGTIYQAVQQHPHRTVALKLMKAGLSSPSLLRRFRYEAEVLGRLQHPNIARVYDAGTHDDGTGAVPYFVLEWIAEARTLTEYARLENLETPDRLRLFVKVCGAVHYAHQKGVMHRDLKPANILVDTEGEPKIIDFGVARATDSDMAITTIQTDVGELIGTLQYMSPEQCRADPHDLDLRSDVYSLGVVLYELLCERPPYDVHDTPVYEGIRIIREQTPPRPSSLRPTLRGDVETITMKALEKDRERRYQSAAEFGRDIERYLNHEPIDARKPSIVYQMRMFARRHRHVVAAAALATVALVAGTAVATWQAVRATHAEGVARSQLEAATWKSYIANIAAADAAYQANEFESMRNRLANAPELHRGWEWRYLAALSDSSLATFDHLSRVNAVAVSPDGRSLVSGSEDGSVRLFDLERGEQIHLLRGHRSEVHAVAFNSDGTMVASGSWDDAIVLWDVAAGKEIRRLEGHEERVYCLAFSHDGTRLVSGSSDRTIRLWDPASGEPLEPLFQPGSVVLSVAFSPDDSRFAAGLTDGTIRLFETTTGRELEPLRPPIAHGDAPKRVRHTYPYITNDDAQVLSVAFSPDGTKLASGAEDKMVRLWDASSGELLATLRGHEHDVLSVAFNPAGTSLASGSRDQTIRLWHLATGRSLATIRGHGHTVSSVAFFDDGRALASASRDGTVRLWDVAVFPNSRQFEGHLDTVRSLAFGPDGARLASGSLDGTLKLWDVRTASEIATLPEPGGIEAMALSADGTLLAAGSRKNNAIGIWSTATGESLIRFEGAHLSHVRCLAFSHDGTRLASGAHDGTLLLWDLETAEPTALTGVQQHVTEVDFDPSDRWLAAAWSDGTIRLWDVATGDELQPFPRQADAVRSLAFSPDGAELASVSVEGSIKLWDVATRSERLSLHDDEGAVDSVAYSPDGTRLVTGSYTGKIKFWDVPTGQELASLRGHEGRVSSLAFSPDGTRLVSAEDASSVIRLWDTVPIRTRVEERDQARRDRAWAAPLVSRLFATLFLPSAVVQAIDSDPELDPGQRCAAVNLVMDRGLRHGAFTTWLKEPHDHLPGDGLRADPGTDYVTSWSGELRISATAHDTEVLITDLETGAAVDLATDPRVDAARINETTIDHNPFVLSRPGDMFVGVGGDGDNFKRTLRVRIRSHEARGGGRARPVTVWTGSRLESASNSWGALLPPVPSRDHPGRGVGRDFVGFVHSELVIVAPSNRGALPARVLIENLDRGTTQELVLDGSAPPCPPCSDLPFPSGTTCLWLNAPEVQVVFSNDFDDDRVIISTDTDVSVLVGHRLFAPAGTDDGPTSIDADWSYSPRSFSGHSKATAPGTLFYAVVRESLTVFPTDDDTTVRIHDLSDGDDTQTVLLSHGNPFGETLDIFTTVHDRTRYTGPPTVPRGVSPQVNIFANGDNAFDNDVVMVTSDKPVMLYAGPTGSNTMEFCDSAPSRPIPEGAHLLYAYAQNGAENDMQLFTIDPDTRALITSLSQSFVTANRSHHHDFAIDFGSSVVVPHPPASRFFLSDARFFSSPSWGGELLQILSDKPIMVISGDCDGPNFGTFVPFVGAGTAAR